MKKNKKQKRIFTFGLIFWVGFIVIMCFLFYLNRKSISKTITKINGSPSTSIATAESQKNDIKETIEKNEGATHTDTAEEHMGDEAQDKQNTSDTDQKKDRKQDIYYEQESELHEEKDDAQRKDPLEKSEEASLIDEPKQDEKPDETRTIDVYFVSVSDSGAITREKCARTIQKTSSPMKDSLNALLEGTTKEEAKKGIRSFIPADTKLLSATIKDGIATINLSEDFQFNRYGVEGYNIQLQQIVFTACSFKNVEAVQFLIEGQKRDFLGSEGIWIADPFTMNSF